MASKGSVEWAARPAKRARARGPRKWLSATPRAERRAWRAEICHEEGVARNAKWGEHIVTQVAPVRGDGFEEGTPRGAIGAEVRGSGIQRPFEHDGGTIVERVG